MIKKKKKKKKREIAILKRKLFDTKLIALLT